MYMRALLAIGLVFIVGLSLELERKFSGPSLPPLPTPTAPVATNATK